MEVEKILTSIAKSQGLVAFSIKESENNSKNNGYIGNISKFCIKDKNGDKCVHVVVKSAPEDDLLREKTIVEQLFTREIYVYEKIFREFVHLQNKRVEYPFVNVECYGTSLKHKSEMLVLKDITFDGYEMAEKSKTFDEYHVKLVLETYGKLHALSFALREEMPEAFEKLTQPMDSIWRRFLEETGFINAFVSMATKAIDVFNSNDKFYIEIYNKFIQRGIKEEFYECFTGDSKYFVITHGDGWINNFMFKYQDDKPISMYLLDFQVSSFTTPVFDLSYFLCACAGKEIFDNIDQYLQVYHDSLSSQLKSLGIDSNKVFPLTKLNDLWKKYSKVGVITSSLTVHGILTQPHEFQGFDQVIKDGRDILETFNYPIANREIYKKRMRDVITHFIDRNMI